jgi:hypothetical protein
MNLSIKRPIIVSMSRKRTKLKVTAFALTALIMCQVIQNSDAARLASVRVYADRYSTEHSKAMV